MTQKTGTVDGSSAPTPDQLARIREEAMDLANVGIYRYRLDGTLVFMDRGALRLLDVEDQIGDPTLLHGRKLADLLEYVDTPGSLRRRVLEQGIVRNLEYHYRTLKGEDRWAYHTAFVVDNPETGEPEIQVLTRDITELKRALFGLEASERRLRTLIESSPQGILVFAGEPPRVLLANAAAGRLTGFSQTDGSAPGAQEVAAWFHPEDRSRVVACLVSRGQAGLGEGPPELRLIPGGDRTLWVELTTSEITLDGAPALQVILADGTARREAEQQRRELESRMHDTQRLESLGVLAGGVAHDFNNLLAAILGNTELLRDRTAADPELACHVDEIATAAERAADLCRQLLAYSGRRPPDRRPLDLSRLVEESTRLLGITVPRRVELVLALAPGLPAVSADASQLRQVVVNLAVNAAEALVEGSGRVSIRTGLEVLDEAGLRRLVRDAQLAPGPHVFLEVEDDGCGMTDEVRNHIFDPFYTTKFTGRGLGMAAVRGIVRGHGGAFGIQSTPGVGTRLRVYLPALPTTAAPSEERAKESREWRGSGVVLLADDEPAPRGVTARLIEALGFEVVTAGGGPEAVARFQESPGRFRLAVLDVVMPGLDGPGVCRRLRELAPGLPVLFISGYDDEGLEEVLALPETGFLQKPFKLSDLRDRLRGLALSREGQV